MMKFVLALLLAANGALLAYHQGYLSDWFPNAHEPERMARQIHPEQMHLISAEVATAPPATPVPAASDSAAAPARPPLTCLEFGDFSVAEAKKFEAELAPLALGERQSRRNVQEINTFVVQIPPQSSKEAADKKAGELRALKVSDFYVINDPASPVRWSISMGVFKTKAAAQSHLEILNKQGVHSAVIASRAGNTSKLTFQLRDLAADTVDKLDALKEKFPAQPGKPCKEPAKAQVG